MALSRRGHRTRPASNDYLELAPLLAPSMFTTSVSMCKHRCTAS